MKKNILMKIISIILLCTIVLYTIPVLAYTKEESIYTKMDANGNIYSTIVSEHLKNTENYEFLNDLSDLLNIENISDTEKSTDGNNINWKANGKDVYYSGTTIKELPIDCKITYKLNGEEISKEEIVGKSGKVEIVIKYINKESHILKINGKNTTMYTPFIVGCGTIIDNETNKNIKIENGKVIDNGNKTMIFGLAMPGLQESLNISKDIMEIPNSITISMETEKFEMKEIYAFATPKILEDKDIDTFNNLDSLYSKVNTLKSSSDMLEKGINDLKDGTNTYYKKSQEFNNAMIQVNQGITNANEKYTQINNGINSLKTSSNTLSQGAKDLLNGTETISEKLVDVNKSVTSLKEGGKSLQIAENQVDMGISQILSQLSEINGDNNSKKITNLENLIKNNENTINLLTNTNITIQNNIKQLNIRLALDTIKEEEKLEIDNQKINLNKQIELNKSLITLLTTNNNAIEQIIKTLKSTNTSNIDDLKNNLSTLKEGVEGIQVGTKKLTDGLTNLETGTGLLAEKTEELTNGTKELYIGTEALVNGTKVLSTGSSQVKSGLNILDEGAITLQNASNSLVEGAKTISGGAETLSQGIIKFNKEGINTIVNLVNGEVKDIEIRFEKLKELSNNYTNFTKIDKSANGSVKFIMIIDSVKEDNIKQQAIIQNVETEIKNEEDE